MPARSGDQQPRFLILDIDQTADLEGETGSYVAVCELHLPEMKTYVEIEEILIRCDPPPAPMVQLSAENSTEGKAPAFTTSTQNRLFVITLSTTVVLEDAGDHRSDASRTICIFIPLSTLTSFLGQKSPELIESNKLDEELFLGDYAKWPMRQIGVPWTDWMRGGARVLSVPGAELIWVCNVFGSRFVHAVEPWDPSLPRAPRHIAVLDFHADTLHFDRAHARLEQSRESSPETESSDSGSSDCDGKKDLKDRTVVEDHLEPSTLQAAACGVFEEDVTTCLPYRRTVFPEKIRFDGVMLSEDNIVLVHVSVPFALSPCLRSLRHYSANNQKTTKCTHSECRCLNSCLPKRVKSVGCLKQSKQSTTKCIIVF